jgi:hypothetical protein
VRSRTAYVQALQHHPDTSDARRRQGYAPMTTALLSSDLQAPTANRTGPSFAAALCGFISTTVATTMLLVLIGTL